MPRSRKPLFRSISPRCWRRRVSARCATLSWAVARCAMPRNPITARSAGHRKACGSIPTSRSPGTRGISTFSRASATPCRRATYLDGRDRAAANSPMVPEPLMTDPFALDRLALRAEGPLVDELARTAGLSDDARARVSDRAAGLIREVRAGGSMGMMEALLAEYGLSTKEGVALMCLAEAMLRVPDSETVDDLIRDKITPHDWGSHIGDSGSIMVNASTWALMLTGRVLDDEDDGGVAGTLHGLVRRMGEPVIRQAVGRAMAEMGNQFVLGRTIKEAMKRGQGMVAKGYSYSFDMLGEAARTHDDAGRYFESYASAIA